MSLPQRQGHLAAMRELHVAWTGRVTVGARLGGRNAFVRVGDFLLPRQASFVVEGENGQPDLEVLFEVRDGRPECVRVEATAKDGGRPIRTSDLQVLALDALTTSVYARVSLESRYDPESSMTTSEPISDERTFWEAVNAVDSAVKAPRRGTTLAELEQVAKVYQENLDSSPVKQVQAVLDYGSERTAARRVQQARDAGLLPPTTPGRRSAWTEDEERARAAANAGPSESGAVGHPKTKRGLRAAVKRLESEDRPDLALIYQLQLEAMEAADRGKRQAKD